MIRWCIERKIAISMIFLGTCLLGTIALLRLPIQLLPNIEFPSLTIITPYPNAAPTEVEKLVTRRIEEAASSVTGVRELRSESIEGLSLVTARFFWDTPMDFAFIETKEKVDMMKGNLPEDAGKSIVVKYDPESEPFMIFAVCPRKIDHKKLRHTIERDIIPLIERIEGVAMVEAYGGFQRQINVHADAQAMAARGISFDDILRAISSANYNFPAGSIEVGNKEYEVRTVGEFKSPFDINSIVVAHNDAGVPIYLSQIAHVEDGWKDQKSIIRFNGNDAVGLFVIREGSKNALETSHAVKTKIEALSNKYKDEMSFFEVSNQANFVSDSVTNVRNAGIIGTFFTFIVLLLFLSEQRAAFIVASSIPISVLTTFALMYAKGMSLNSMSLGGLALGIGMMVDSAIVVVESIAFARSVNQQKQQNDTELIANAVEEVKTSVIASILTTLVVFLPIIFLSGIAGSLFGDLALTISFSLIATLASSLLLIPMLASLPVKKSSLHSSLVAQMHLRAHATTERFLASLVIIYESLLQKAIQKKKKLFILGLIIACAGIALTLMIKRELLPKVDSGEFFIDIQAPRGTPLTETLKLTKAVEDSVRKNRHVAHVFSKTGCDPEDSIAERLSGKMRDFATLRVNLKNSFRPHISSIIEEIRQNIGLYNGVTIDFRIKEDIIQSVLDSKKAATTIEIHGRDFEMLRKTGNELIAHLKNFPGIVSTSASLDEGNPEIRLVVEKTKSFAHGLTIADAASTLRCAVAGEIATTFREGDEETDVRLRLRDDARNDLHALSSLFVKSKDGVMLEIGKFAFFNFSFGPTRITRINQSRANIVTVEGSASRKDIARAVETVSRNMGMEMRVVDEHAEIMKSLPGMLFALALAVVLVYMVLASQFSSFILPLVVMGSIPLTLIGSSGALFLTGKSLNINSLIGMILLAGTVVNNAIVLVDFISKNVAKGMELPKAVVLSIHRRIRPIMMTTITTVLGMFPLALGVGSGAEIQQPLAIAVIGGLLCSTMLTLIFIPACYFHLKKGLGR